VRRADDNSYTLATNASATGSGVNIRGGEYMFCVDGTVGGATVSLQFLLPSGQWSVVSVFNSSAVQSTTLPYAQTAIDLPAGQVRLGVASGTPSGLNASLVGLG